ncbi:iron-containing alcohol dehydrogenase [Pontiella sulfatireligans]|uniref:1,3-propanediol dehydrogenase n=1 Tax=Pontiella sulfatireligans TaxID=2750658 RepID=A0A6C2UV82_9BACT|nr:iron-containing alcohol dehydrogenase [Pontiella sulfatireligans]VGO22756.1 1,3-propanediol dehydrogenase [Pontiella sulfatireligans]
MNFEFATAQRIIFGTGKLKELPELAQPLGRRAALITGTSAERIGPVFQALKNCGANPAAFSIRGEPTTDRIATLVQQARDLGCDYVVAFGGGSVIDAGKAIAALLTNTRDLMDYLEVIGGGEPLTKDPAPCIAIPTTAGTGAEVTRNSVLQSPEHKVKVSMRHPKMLPTVALIDPELTLTMPPEVTASTGLDAFTQLLEAFVSSKSNPLTDGICREGLEKASGSLQHAYMNGNDIKARTDMAAASLFGGLALANAGLGAVHGFAGPIGGMFEAPHGMVCASLLPAVVDTNIQALEDRDATSPALEKYKEAARIVTGSPNATPNELLQWIVDCCMQMMVPGLSDFGISEDDLPAIVEKAKCASSMKGNPVKLTDAELAGILAGSLHPPVDGNATLYL